MWLLRKGRNVLLLSACQALFWGALMIGITMSGLAGQMLADHKALATLPAGIMALTTIFVTSPASRLMQRRGRRSGFLLGVVAGVVGGLICVAAIFAQDFLLFCLGNAVLGLRDLGIETVIVMPVGDDAVEQVEKLGADVIPALGSLH